MISPRHLADIWRNPRDPRWSEAFEQIRKLFQDVARRHPRVQRLRSGGEDERLDELLHEFWIHLTLSPARLEAKRVRGVGALKTEAWRFLDGLPSYGPADDRGRLLTHLWKKVKTVLLQEKCFQPVGTLWEIKSRQSPEAHSPRDDASIVPMLPSLPARLDPQREGQLPPLVHEDALRSFLESCLRASGRPRSSWQLTQLVWKRLQPSPDIVFALSPESADTGKGAGRGRLWSMRGERSAEEEADRLRWQREIDAVASDFVDSLGARTAQIAKFIRASTITETATKTGQKRSTTHNEIKRFRDAFTILVERQSLSEAEARELLEAVLDILEAEGF